MKKEELTKYLNKRIKIFLKNNNIFYTGSIQELGEESLILLDKYDKDVILSLDCISHIEVQR